MLLTDEDDTPNRAATSVTGTRRKSARASARERADTALAMLVDLTVAVFATCHALQHVRDEVYEGRVPAFRESVRRDAYLTAVCCFELDRNRRRHD